MWYHIFKFYYGAYPLDRVEFSKIRQSLSKTQAELARLLCVSPRAVQSFEQGWRNIPAGIERQLLFILSTSKTSGMIGVPCWEEQDCPSEWRKKCPAWEYHAGHLCWFINGTYCQGRSQENWKKKIKLCRQCKVFQSVLPGVWPSIMKVRVKTRAIPCFFVAICVWS